jgi:negative regulator of sigma E activity
MATRTEAPGPGDIGRADRRRLNADLQMDDIENEPTDHVVSAARRPGVTVAELASELRQGRSWRTPFLALGGTALMVAAALVVILALAFAGYSIFK